MSDAGGDSGGGALPACTSMKDSDPSLSAADFCKLLAAKCPANLTADYNTTDKCLAKYGASAKMGCQTYHMCNVVRTGDVGTHCPHAQGAAPCN
jgi:hypothetical protein